MKLKYDFVVMDMGGEFAAVPVGDTGKDAGFRGMLKLNDVSAGIIELLKEDTTPEQVHRALIEKYPDSTVDEIGCALADFLNHLAREGLLITP